MAIHLSQADQIKLLRSFDGNVRAAIASIDNVRFDSEILAKCNVSALFYDISLVLDHAEIDALKTPAEIEEERRDDEAEIDYQNENSSPYLTGRM